MQFGKILGKKSQKYCKKSNFVLILIIEYFKGENSFREYVMSLLCLLFLIKQERNRFFYEREFG